LWGAASILADGCGCGWQIIALKHSGTQYYYQQGRDEIDAQIGLGSLNAEAVFN